MMQTMDLTNLGDGLVLNFGGDFNQINAETFSRVLIEFSRVLKNINRLNNSSIEIDIYIDAFESGCFKAKIKTISKKIAPNLSYAVANILLGVFTAFVYDKYFDVDQVRDQVVNIEMINDSYVVEYESMKIVLPREAEKLYPKVAKSPEIEKHVSVAFGVLDKDPEIKYFGIANKFEDRKLLVRVPSSDFSQVSTERKLSSNDRVRYNVEEKEVDLRIIGVFFERDAKWQFEMKNDQKIFAQILDETFYDKLDNHKYAIHKGDSIRVLLEIFQHKDGGGGRLGKKKYEVKKVLKFTSGNQKKSTMKR